ncbi:MAG: cytochrome c maturation protein CcmE [Sphingomonadales bacterium]|nr:cytochrome c maturation protein CcmE [Sphingomonadales bacterium]
MRLIMIVSAMAVFIAAGLLAMRAMDENLVFFVTPSDVVGDESYEGKRFRLGGLVEEGSFEEAADGITVSFNVTDGAATMPVIFADLLPDLFREGQGVVAEGVWVSGLFQADTVLAKHDENYMPAEVADKLKETGMWQDPKQNNVNEPS